MENVIFMFGYTTGHANGGNPITLYNYNTTLYLIFQLSTALCVPTLGLDLNDFLLLKSRRRPKTFSFFMHFFLDKTTTYSVSLKKH